MTSPSELKNREAGTAVIPQLENEDSVQSFAVGIQSVVGDRFTHTQEESLEAKKKSDRVSRPSYTFPDALRVELAGQQRMRRHWPGTASSLLAGTEIVASEMPPVYIKRLENGMPSGGDAARETGPLSCRAALRQVRKGRVGKRGRQGSEDLFSLDHRGRR